MGWFWVGRETSARKLALTALTSVHQDGAFANLVLPALLAESDLDLRDRGFTTELVYGSLRLEGELDIVIAQAAKRETATIDPLSLDILRLGTYQALHMRVSGHAVVNESVRLAKASGAHRSAGFINAVLRRVTENPPAQWALLISESSLSFHAHPPWIAQEICLALAASEGADECEEALQAHNQAPTVTVALLPGLSTHTPEDSPTQFSPIGIVLPGGNPSEDPRIAGGSARVQDEGSQLAALLLTGYRPLRSDEAILDMCAGPGGKTAVLTAQASLAGAKVFAVEKVPHRAALVRDSVRAITARDPGVLEVHVGDAPDISLDVGLFDRILLDAPCTGLGALRRRPEARWRKAATDIPGLVALQSALLERAIAWVKPGGLIAYVTCSPVTRETTDVIDAALLEHPTLIALDTPAVLDQISKKPVEGARRGSAVQLWTHRHGTDAMFIQLLTTANTG